MTTLASLILLLALGFAALLTVGLINYREIRARRTQQRLKMLKFRVDALEELAILLDRIVDSRLIVHHVYDEALTLLDAMQQLDSNAAYLQAAILHALRRAEEFKDQHRTRTRSRAMETDASIAKARQALSEAGQILRQRYARGQLSSTDLEIFIRELNRHSLYVPVISLIGRGLVAMKKGNIPEACAFYGKARVQLLDTKRQDEKQERLIKELNEMVESTRLLPSPDLMPEALPIYEAAAGPDSETTPHSDRGDETLAMNINEGLANGADRSASL